MSPYARLGLVLVLLVTLSAGLALGLRAVFPGLVRWESRPERVAEGVCLEFEGLRVELGGLDRFRALGALEEIAERLTLRPRDAYVERLTGGAVPGLDGRELDVAATVDLALAAKPGETVSPVFTPIPPAVTLAQFRAEPVYHGNPAKSQVAIILNIAWGDEFLTPILDLVEQAGGRLTICPVGNWLEGNAGGAAWLKQAADRGHEIGNHGYFNRAMTYGADKVREEIAKTSDLIQQATAHRPTVFAPPMGAFAGSTLEAAAQDGYVTVLWSLDTVDWRLDGVDVIAGRVTSRAKAGDIILCHPTAQTGPAMEKFLPVLAAKGLKVVTVSELLSTALPGAREGCGPGP